MTLFLRKSPPLLQSLSKLKGVKISGLWFESSNPLCTQPSWIDIVVKSFSLVKVNLFSILSLKNGILFKERIVYIYIYRASCQLIYTMHKGSQAMSFCNVVNFIVFKHFVYMLRIIKCICYWHDFFFKCNVQIS